MKKPAIFLLTISLILTSLCGCGSSAGSSSNTQSAGAFSIGGSSKAGNTSSGKNTNSNGSSVSTSNSGTGSGSDSSAGSSTGSGTRSNTPQVLTPTADGKVAVSNDVACIDTSNAEEGYIMASYTGSNPKVKIRITKAGETTYTYDMVGGYETFPLSAGSGEYTIVIYENISGTDYSTCLSTAISVTLSNEFGPYLYPNKYVWFTDSSKVVSKGAEVVASADSDLDAVSLIYNFVINHLTYDHDHAANLENGYIPDPDRALTSGTGICLDYATLMAAMLRTQNIPTHLEVGYAGTAYHAWISVYITDIGWINGMIEFDGVSWKIMDPTYAANSSNAALKQFIGDNSNYQVKYVY